MRATKNLWTRGGVGGVARGVGAHALRTRCFVSGHCFRVRPDGRWAMELFGALWNVASAWLQPARRMPKSRAHGCMAQTSFRVHACVADMPRDPKSGV